MRNVKVLKRIKAGVHGYALHSEEDEGSPFSKGRSTISYRTNDLSSCLEDLVDGGWVIDGSDLPMKDARRATISGPMLDVTLEDDQVDKAPEPSDALVEGMEGVFGELTKRAKEDQDFSGLDNVGTRTYVAFWQRVGARIGRRKGDEIHWADGEVESIES